jgi:hypothetical protein
MDVIETIGAGIAHAGFISHLTASIITAFTPTPEPKTKLGKVSAHQSRAQAD